jgi:hypothetical protein
MWRVLVQFRPSERVGQHEPCLREAAVSDGKAQRRRATSLQSPSSDSSSPAHHVHNHVYANLSPYRRRLHWTPPFAGCDSDNLLCGSGSACEAAVAPSSPLTTCQPAAPPAGNTYNSLVARLQARYSFNVRGRALSQTPASLLQSALSGTRIKVCLCCAAPAHTAAFGSHVTFMERANLIAPARRRHIPDTTEHLWLPRTHDWKGIEQ